MKSFRNALILLVTSGLALLVIWQGAQIKNLRSEALALREQLSEVLAAPGQPASMPVTGTPVEPRPNDTSVELLRLRGQVSILRRQLAEVSKTTNSGASDIDAKQASLTATESDSEARERQAEEAKQKFEQLLAALKLSPDTSLEAAESALSTTDFRSYASARRDAEEAERFAQIGRLKVAAAHSASDPAGENAPAQ